MNLHKPPEMAVNRKIILKSGPFGQVDKANFEFIEEPLVGHEEGDATGRVTRSKCDRFEDG